MRKILIKIYLTIRLLAHRDQLFGKSITLKWTNLKNKAISSPLSNNNAIAFILTIKIPLENYLLKGSDKLIHLFLNFQLITI